MKSPATRSKPVTRLMALPDQPNSNRPQVRTTSWPSTNAKRSNHCMKTIRLPVTPPTANPPLTPPRRGTAGPGLPSWEGSGVGSGAERVSRLRRKLSFLVVALLCWSIDAGAADKKIVLVAGRPSHGPGDHEFNAGVQLLHKCLEHQPGIVSTFHLNGWPKDPHAFEGAATILFFMDGGGGHPIIQDDHLKIIGELMKKGVGLVCVHYAVEVPKEKGGPEFLDWIGGYYETGFSTNPHWEADFTSLSKHPITRGVKPFKIRDEWY